MIIKPLSGFLAWVVGLVVLPAALRGAPGGAASTPALGEEPPAVERSFPEYARSLWAIGSAGGIDLVLARRPDGQAGFQLFQRDPLEDRLRPGRVYTGKPYRVGTLADRLLIFFEDGACRSYTHQSPARTEPRLPTSCRLLASAGDARTLVVLVHTAAPAEFPFCPTLAGVARPGALVLAAREPESPDANQPASVAPATSGAPPAEPAPTIGFGANVCLLLARQAGDPWHTLTDQPLPIDPWLEAALLMHADALHVFGLPPADSGDGAVLHGCWRAGRLASPASLPTGPTRALTALMVNRQPRLIIAAPAEPNAASGTASGVTCFRLGWPDRNGWHFSAPLERRPGQVLLARPEALAFAAADQSIEAFEYCSDLELRHGRYSLAGAVLQNLDAPLSTAGAITPPWLRHSLGYAASLVCLGLNLAVVFWRRRTAFSAPPTAPAWLAPASPLRRLLAFLLDAIPAWLFTLPLFPGLADLLNDNYTLLEQPYLIAENPLLLRFVLTYQLLLVVYIAVCEMFFSCTPGKLALRLFVLNEDFRPLTPRQALVRNLFRLAEFTLPIVVLLLLLVTPRRQRAGDLAARTLVVLRTPGLYNHLFPHRRRPENDDDPAPPAPPRHGA